MTKKTRGKMRNKPFFDLLHKRGVTLKALAADLETSVTHLSEVFSGTRKGRCSRKHIAKLLRPEELELLGWRLTVS